MFDIFVWQNNWQLINQFPSIVAALSSQMEKNIDTRGQKFCRVFVPNVEFKIPNTPQHQVKLSNIWGLPWKPSLRYAEPSQMPETSKWEEKQSHWVTFCVCHRPKHLLQTALFLCCVTTEHPVSARNRTMNYWRCEILQTSQIQCDGR